MWNKVILKTLAILLFFSLKHLLDLHASSSNLPECECYWWFPVHVCPFALLCEILIHFFSLSWAIEYIIGAKKPLQTKLYFFGGEKTTIKLCCWFGNRPGVKSFWSHVELDESPQTKSSKMKKNGVLWKPSFVSLCRELTILFWGCWASTESLALNDCTERGIHTSPDPELRNQRSRCPWMKEHGPQPWLAAGEDTRSAGIVLCVTDHSCWVGQWRKDVCCCHFNTSTCFGMACHRNNL